MVDHRHYLPILKGKAGEYDALEHLCAGVKPLLTPIIEVPPIEWKYGDELGVPTEPKRTIDKHVEQVAENIRKSWGTDFLVYIDLLHVQKHDSLADGAHPLAHVFDRGRHLHLQAIPVTGIDRPDAYQNAVIRAVERDRRGVCIRLDQQGCRSSTWVGEHLRSLVMTLKVGYDQVDVILDIGAITADEVVDLRWMVRSLVQDLPCVNELRTLALAATSMPKSVTIDMDPFSVKRIPRAERTLWCGLANDPDLPRVPSFSDYGVTHPDYFDQDPREVRFAGKIRYTAENTWVIVKGRKLEGAGCQFHRLAQMITEQPEFPSRGSGWGDESIAKCAVLEIGPGNQTTWIAYGTNRHLTFVTRQVANGP